MPQPSHVGLNTKGCPAPHYTELGMLQWGTVLQPFPWDQRYGSIHGARNFLAALRMASFVSLDWESAYCLIPAASLPGLQVSSISPLLFCHPGLGCRPNQICSPLVPCCVQHILWPAYFSCPAHSSRLPTAAPSCIYNTSSPTSNHLHPLWHTHDHWNSTGFQSLQDELRLGKK